jgi:F-type H+-transporting ATPase subunit alpha
MALGHEVLILYAVTNGHLDDVAVPDVNAWEKGLHDFVDASHPELLRMIESDGELKRETETLMTSVILEFKTAILQG